MKKLRDYQLKNATECADILKSKGLVYLCHSPRTGKTTTAFEVILLFGAKKILFLTKKKAIGSIENDYNDFGFSNHFKLTVTNYENLHNIDEVFDLIVCDENHVNSAFPKPSKRTKEIKLRYSRLPMIFLSGTPATESMSQYYHSLWISSYSPFKEWTNFYKWSKMFIDVKQKNHGYGLVNDYTNAKDDLINKYIKDYIHIFTQKEAGFSSEIEKNILWCEMHPQTRAIINTLKKDKIVKGKEKVILADTAVKLQNKIMQLCSGTIKFEDETSMIIDYSKFLFVKEHFKNKKIAIFYYYKEELNGIKEVFKDNVTTSLEEFNTSDKNIALQQYAGAEGINLSKSDHLVFINFGFSGSKFIQSIDRLTTMDRLKNEIYFIFGYGGIESKVFKSVSNKENYTNQQFKKDELSK